MRTLLLLALLTSISTSIFAQTLIVKFDNIRSNKGVVYVTLYETEDTWLDEDFDYYEFIFSKENIDNNKLTVSIDSIKPGYYGIAVLDDEDEDSEMRYNFIGFPREGFGFSRNVRARLFKPKFEECVLEIKNDTTISITMQYK